MPRSEKSAAEPLAWLYTGLIVYASLFPFTGWRDQGIVPWAYLRSPWPRYWTGFDLVTNLAGYAPLGFLLALGLMRRLGSARAAMLASVAALLLSFTMENLQSYLPMRVASNVDLGLNAVGGTLGAAVALVLARLGVLERVQSLRAGWFERDSRGAQVLLALWPLGLLFPAPVAFGMGQVYERLEEGLAALLMDTPFLEWLPLREIELQPLWPAAELACVALGALVPGLLGYTVIAGRARRALFALLALAAGMGVSALSAALTYGPQYAWAWIDAPVQRGVPLAAMGAAVLLVLPPRWCERVLVAVVLAQLLLLNQAPQNAYFATTLQSWEQGRFIHFYGLAQWLGWLWPYATLLYLASRVLARRPAPRIET